MPILSKRTTKLRKKRLRKKKSAIKKSRKEAARLGRRASKLRSRTRKKAFKALRPTQQIVEMGHPKTRTKKLTSAEALSFIQGAGEFSPAVVAAEDELGLIHCPACHTMRPAEDFADVTSDTDPGAPPIACRVCRTHGREPAVIVPGIDPRTAYIISRRAAGAPYAKIAAETKLSVAQVRAIAAGEVLEGQTARRAFALALRQVGVDPIALARKGAELLGAEKYGYAGGEGMELIPDNAIQAATWRHLTKLSDLEPPKQKVSTSRAIKIVTNLDADHPEDRSGEITAKITRRVEATA